MTETRVTELLADLRQGRKAAIEELMPLIYGELRVLASYYMRGERRGHTLQTTALVHEAYLRLAGQDWANWEDRAHFLGVAARQMRRVLVEYARQYNSMKRGGTPLKPDMDALALRWDGAKLVEILAVNKALEKLNLLDAQQARIVELRYFGGLTVEEAAALTGLGARTVKRDWAVAMAWLRAELCERERQ